MYCGEGSIVKEDSDATRVVTLRCRSWNCPECAPRRRRELIALALAGKPTTFITLTCSDDVRGEPYAKARRLADAWRIVVRRAKARYGLKKLEYFAVFEATKKGTPHLHILSTVRWLDQRWLSDQMNEIMASPIVDIRRVDSAGRAVRYVAKYVGKQPHHFGTCKRYWHTQDWNGLVLTVPTWARAWLPEKAAWRRSKESTNQWEAHYQWLGWEVERHGDYLEARPRAGPKDGDDVPF